MFSNPNYINKAIDFTSGHLLLCDSVYSPVFNIPLMALVTDIEWELYLMPGMLNM